ncbi:DUF1700 domain-containing protein [Oscillospiraceae bacterium CM]|nr:DUF1700 domain-containing protein [Oscillospiraceae bacterium CM]
MTKQEYLNELKNQLKANNVSDIDEILAEYKEHFDRKMADGYTEEEIAKKLGAPPEIAAQFALSGTAKEVIKSNKIFAGVGLFFADIFVASFFALLFSWVLVLALSAVSSCLVGLCLLLRPLLPAFVLLPVMPYAGGALLGIDLIALGVLFAVAAVWFIALTRQMARAYRRWHKNVMTDGKYPPYALHPVMKDTARRQLRIVGLLAVLIFVVFFAVSYVVLAISAGAVEFWHVWHWFV